MRQPLSGEDWSTGVMPRNHCTIVKDHPPRIIVEMSDRSQPLDHPEQQSGSAEISFDNFQKVDIRVGRVLSAEPLDGARKPAYKLRIDFGPELGVKQSSAQITERYQPAELIGKLVLAVVNFPPRRIAGFRSDVLTLGVADLEGAVILIAPDREVPLGARLF